MSRVLRSLLWKEWHEQQWKAVFGCVILSAYTAIGLETRLLPDEETLLAGMFVAGLLLPILVSMDLVAAERAEGSLTSLLVLPVRAWVSFAVKTATGALTCVLPFGWAMAVAILMAGGREIPVSQIALISLGGMGLCLSLFIWIHCVGVRQASEARAGLVGMAVIAAMAAALTMMSAFERTTCQQLCYIATPVVFPLVTMTREPEVLPHAAWIQGLIAVALLFWAGRRFTKLGRTPA